jgi:hypothetical protein
VASDDPEFDALGGGEMDPEVWPSDPSQSKARSPRILNMSSLSPVRESTRRSASFFCRSLNLQHFHMQLLNIEIDIGPGVKR